MSRFDGKVALITGAGLGIGAATALHLASLGCSLALNDISDDKLTEQCQSIRQKTDLGDRDILLIPGDISIEEKAESIVRESVAYFDHLDILINNAGILRRAKLQNTSLTDMDEVFRTSFRAAFHLIQLSIPHLKFSKGAVVNLSSVASHLAVVNQIAYGASKAALDHLTKSVARDLGPFGVRVNAINPGIVATNIYRTVGLSDERSKGFMTRGNLDTP